MYGHTKVGIETELKRLGHFQIKERNIYLYSDSILLKQNTNQLISFVVISQYNRRPPQYHPIDKIIIVITAIALAQDYKLGGNLKKEIEY